MERIPTLAGYGGGNSDVEALEYLRAQLVDYHDATENNPDVKVRIGLNINMYKAGLCPNNDYCRARDAELYVSWSEGPGKHGGGDPQHISKTLAGQLLPIVQSAQYTRYDCFLMARLLCSPNSVIDDRPASSHPIVEPIRNEWDY